MLNSLKERLARAFPAGTREEAWRSDPLMHPDIQAMDQTQIADLPMWTGGHLHGGSTRQRGQGKAEGAVRRGARRLAMSLGAVLLAGFVWASTDVRAQSPGTSAAFAMPAHFDEWRPDVFGQNGAYRFRQTNGNCQITLAQNRGAQAARAAGQEPRDSLNAYIDRVAAQVGRLERAEVDGFELAAGPNGKVPFVSSEFAYEGNDKVEYHNRISAAWIDDVELLIVSACPVSEWLSARQSIDAFINKVSITRLSGP